MVSTLTWVLAGVIAYTLAGMVLKSQGLVPESVRFSGPITTIHTKKGRELLDRLAAPAHFWRAWTNFGLGVGFVVMAGSFLTVVFSAYQSYSNPVSTQLTEPRNVLVIPGVNDFLPLSIAPEIVAGFVVTLFIHEAGHGLLCRAGDIDISSMGVAFLTVIPLGAFVEPDEEQLSEADRGVQARMFVAGVFNNFALGLICLLLLVGPVIGAVTVVSGVPVGGTLPGSPADQAGIESGAVITSVGGQPVNNSSQLDARLEGAGQQVDVGLRDESDRTVDRSIVVTSAVQDSPVAINRTIVAVNGTSVATTTEFRQEIANRSVATLTFSDGENRTIPIGAFAPVSDEGPLVEAGATPDEAVYITRVDGERTQSATAVQRALADETAGDSVRVTVHTGTERRDYNVTLAASSQYDPGLGVTYIARGTSGFIVDDFGVRPYPAGAYLSLLGGDPPEASQFEQLSTPRRIAMMIGLPFATATLGFDFNFAGFTGDVTNFYTATGPLSVLGDGGVFLLVNLLFWTGLINLLAGQFNLIPAYPLDGGHLLRVCTESVVARLPVENRSSLRTAVTVTVSLTMLGSLLFIMAAPRILG